MVSVLGMSLFFFLISTQSYQGINILELVDVNNVFLFLISTQSYQGIKLVELVDSVFSRSNSSFFLSLQSQTAFHMCRHVVHLQ
ncbi:hypothetical protein LAZ67_8001819 [Cordylochernes scorpioides]|uniref:Secreted protein n=1 Tax=Cordylochernes scorpioides TaxID=51811 RepID=A0ABY6KQI8_9ARAC|nr:hypothetical protein LAZ67_8001819 [Cordylochernes scorpioides]